jgi:hypothetical protein
VRNVENLLAVRISGAGMRGRCGKPAVRGAEFPWRDRVPMKRMPGGRKAAGKRGRRAGTSSRWSWYKWPGCRVLLPGPERALTWAGEPLRRSEREMPELTGTLDTSVNGPEGLPSFDGDAWERADWRHHEEQVRRLRGRIFKAVVVDLAGLRS